MILDKDGRIIGSNPGIIFYSEDTFMNPQQTSAARICSPLHVFLIVLVGILCGCSSTKYHQDFKPGTDFSGHQTYNWRNTSSEIPGLNPQQIQRLADAQLAGRGLTRTESNPDILLDMTIVTRVSTGSSTGLGLSIGLPVGRHGSIGVGGGRSVPNDKQEGIIIVDVTDASTNNLIWRGSAEAVPVKYFSLSNEEKLAAVVSKLLSQYPPQ